MMAIVGGLNLKLKSVAPCKSASARTAGNADGDAVCASCGKPVGVYERAIATRR